MQHLPSAPWRKLVLGACLSLGCATAAHAQLIHTASVAQNLRTTYTDLGTVGTVITTANTDDALSGPQDIGFSFNYNGMAHTQFVLSTNGFIKLGGTAPSAANLLNPIGSASPLDVNMLVPISNLDLQETADQTTTPTEFRVVTTGTAPNRVCTIQFKNLRDKASGTGATAVPAQFATMQFQIRLYETSNVIDFVYGTWTATTNTPLGQTAIIGLKGTTNTSTDWVLALKNSSLNPWSSTVFDQPAGLAAHFMRNTVLPDAGRTYRFRIAPANDGAVQAIYTLGKAPVALPQVVQAVVRNTGSTALSSMVATLNVSGANTFSNTQTVPALAVGASATVSFAAFTPTTVGNNIITIGIPNDAVADNNGQLFNQVITTNTFSYANTDGPDTSVGFLPTASGAFVAKFTTPAARTITTIGVGLADPNSVGRTVYGVVVNAAGAVLSRSADYVVQTVDIDRMKSLPLTAPVSVAAAGDFYIGLVQTAAPTGGVRYFPMAIFSQGPVRPATFFEITPFTGTGGTLTPTSYGTLVLEAQTSIVQGTSEALNRAVAMYPNPSTGLVKLDVRGANAKGSLQVSVLNMLGQTVHTAALKDNFTNDVNLSNLANGMYMLKVQTGADFTTRQLTIAK